MSEVAIGVAGIAGRMGRMIAAAAAEGDGVRLAAGTVRPGGGHDGKDLGGFAGVADLGIGASGDPDVLFEASDVVVDFTTPDLTLRHAELAARTGTPLVIGTTGISSEGEAEIRKAAERAAIVYAANMSLGVNLLLSLVERTARALAEEFDIEVLEMHHRHKVDAPSGTALALGRAAAAGRGVDLSEVEDRGRDGHTGARRRGDIGFAVLRGGDVPGEHSVIFAGEGERIEISHKAGSRTIFAQGAIRAASWAAGREPGLYNMKDVLGLSD